MFSEVEASRGALIEYNIQNDSPEQLIDTEDFNFGF